MLITGNSANVIRKNAESDQLKPIEEGFIDQHSSVLSEENNKPKVNSDAEMLRPEITPNKGAPLHQRISIKNRDI